MSADPDGLAAGALLEEAQRQTGLDDLGGDSVLEGLGVYCDSLASQAKLNDLGVAALPAIVVTSLTNRLRVVEHLKQHPSVADAPIEAPVVVIGLFRAGTTLLSQLLDVDPGARSLLSWESQDSVPPPTPANHRAGERVEQARERMAMMDLLCPALPAIHHDEPDGPTECVTLLSQDFKSLLWETLANVPDYGDWLMATDQRSAYEHHRRCLQVLQSGGVGGRWTLKSPHHAIALDALTAVYPDARLVYLHRDPAVVVASACSLIRTLSGTFSDADHRDYIATRWTRVLLESVDRVEDFRRRHPDHPVLDLRYQQLVTDPLGAVAQIYEFTGRTLEETTATAMGQHLAANPKGRRGAHRYDLADFGLDEDELRSTFAAYAERYEVVPEG